MEQGIIGKVIDNYRITQVLGRGGMGVVYKANEIRLDRDVAIKMMDIRLASEPDFLKRFQSEARALAKLQDPHIVGIFTLRETELGLFIVMEYVEGQTFADMIKKSGPPPLATTLSLFKQLLIAFEHAHRAGIIHRDIKPSNVMISRDGVVKVTDFGLAKIQRHSGSTATMGTGGTLYYMSPEQLKGLANVDQRGDIYSIGMTLYECLTGSVPFSDTESDFGIREAIVRGKIPPPVQQNGSIPKEINRIVMKAIERDPEKRFQNAAEMLSAVEEFERTSTASGRMTGSPSPGPRRKPSPWFLVPALAVLILIVIFLWKPWSSGSQLSVAVDPGGATVEIDGVAVGPAPIRDREMAGGRVRVRVAKDGYRTLDTLVSLVSADHLSLNIRLVPVSQPPVSDSSGLVKETVRPDSSAAVAAVPDHPAGPKPADNVGVNPIRSPEDLATYLASNLRRKTTLASAKVMVMPFTFEDTGISSRFSHAFKHILEQRLTDRAGWSVIRQAENVDPGADDVSSAFAAASGATYMLTGTYWTGENEVRFVTTLRKIRDAAPVGGVEASVRRNLFTNAAYSLRPQNFTQAVSDIKVFNKDVPAATSLHLDVWTNRGKDNLLFVEGERMQAYVRVNMPCFIRFIYHLADGKRALLLDNYQIRQGDTGKPFRIPDEFECAPPFGAEVLQVFARTERFEPVETTEVDGYKILTEDLQKFLIAMRGMRLVNKSTLQAEARVVLTTVAR